MAFGQEEGENGSDDLGAEDAEVGAQAGDSRLSELKDQVEAGKPEAAKAVVASGFKEKRDGLRPVAVSEKSEEKADIGKASVGKTEKVDSVAELKEMAGKYGDTKSVLDKLQYLAEDGEITPEQHAEFLEILSKLNPDCWRGIKFVSFKIPLVHGFNFKGSAKSARKIALNDKMSPLTFTHEIAHNIWDKIMTEEQRAKVEEIHDSLSKEERMATHWKKHPKLSYFVQGGNEEEWFCQAFACWLAKIEPYYANITEHQKLQPVVELFESFRA